MSHAERLFSVESRGINKAHPKDPVLAEWFGGSSNTAAGITVTPDKAMRLTAVFAAVRIIAEEVASLPLIVYRRTKEGKEPAPKHPLYKLLHDQSNRWQTAFEFREMMTGHVVLRGNAYAEIISNRTNPIFELIPLHPDRITSFVAPDKSIAYDYQPEQGETRIILQEEMFHLRGFGSDLLGGISVIEHNREAIGLGMAAEEFGGRFFGNGTVLSGVLEHPNSLSDKALENLKNSWVDRHGGVSRSNRPAILEEGMKWQALGVKPEEAQFLETRKFQISEIARMFRVPPHMLADLEKATFSNIEQQDLNFYKHSIRSWVLRWEQRIQIDLFTTEGRKNFFAKHNLEGFLRGDSDARQKFYSGMFNIGVYSVNEIRELEDKNPVDGGDQRFVPLNMIPLDQAGEVDEVDEEEGDRTRRLRTVQRIARKEVRAVWSALNKHSIGERFTKWANDFFEKHSDFVCEVLAIEEEEAKAYSERTRDELLRIIEDKAPDALDQWGAGRANELMRLINNGY